MSVPSYFRQYGLNPRCAGQPASSTRVISHTVIPSTLVRFAPIDHVLWPRRARHALIVAYANDGDALNTPDSPPSTTSTSTAAPSVQLVVSVASSMSAIDKEAWNKCATGDNTREINPFLLWEFLDALVSVPLSPLSLPSHTQRH